MSSGEKAGAARLAGWLMGTAAVAAAFGAPAALAQETETQQPITVIGIQNAEEVQSDKATAPILDLPLTVTVIPSEVFEEQGARNLTDVLSNTPGITFNAGENGFATGLSNFSLRGFDTSANIFIDGARDSGAYNRDAFNIDRVEVVKGPAGDNGRGGAGGYVNIVTRTPSQEAITIPRTAGAPRSISISRSLTPPPGASACSTRTAGWPGARSPRAIRLASLRRWRSASGPTRG